MWTGGSWLTPWTGRRSREGVSECRHGLKRLRCLRQGVPERGGHAGFWQAKPAGHAVMDRKRSVLERGSGHGGLSRAGKRGFPRFLNGVGGVGG